MCIYIYEYEHIHIYTCIDFHNVSSAVISHSTITLVAGLNSEPLFWSSNSEPDFKNGHISRFSSFLIQVISSERICSAEPLFWSWSLEAEFKNGKISRFQTLLFEKETVKTLFHRSSNSGINESRANPFQRDYLDYGKEQISGDMAVLKIRFRVWASERCFQIRY